MTISSRLTRIVLHKGYWGNKMRFIIGTKNKKKLQELDRILHPLGIEAVSEQDLGITLEEVEETGSTFAENARLKAQAACRQTGLPAIADDSGLCVDALDGAPGVYSARYAGEGAGDQACIDKLLGEMKDVPPEKRTARFVSAVCCVMPSGRELIVHGTCEGMIADAPRGTGGFGYDPVFLVGEKSFSELPAQQKDAVSHRGAALQELARQLPEFLREEK